LNKYSERKALSFDDIDLIPQYSEIESRSKIDTTMKLTTKSKVEYSFKLPIISSPMKSVTESEMCIRMHQNGGLGILHRFCSIEEQVEMVKLFFKECPNGIIGAAIGVNGDYLERARTLVASGVQIICVDIAHGHSSLMKNALSELVKMLPPEIHIMAGNVATGFAYFELIKWGADSVKVGISSGAACSTAIKTGHGLPTLQSILDAHATTTVEGQIIADGGIRKPGDLIKSYAAGADFCILGSMLAGTKASPGKIIHQEDGRWVKEYFGSASEKSQKLAGKTKIYEEGVASVVPYTGKIENTIESIYNGIVSGCSYSGVDKLSNLKYKACYQEITTAGYLQAVPHVKLK
jgi:IMP dehydrogenase